MAHTFMFADLAGFTALTEAHGDEAAADLAARFCRLVRDEMEEYDAAEVKTLGDAMLVRVAQPGEAIALGLGLSALFAGLSGFPILRVGMNTGSAVEREGDWFGSAVNLAARVAAAAGGDEVLLTEHTREAAGDVPGVELEALGRHSFRNVAERVALFRALPPRASKPAALDPVCRMTVDPSRATGELKYDGRTYLFCSLECAAAFSADPKSFTDSND